MLTVSELVNAMELCDHKNGKIKYFEMYARQHGTCVKFSQSAEVKKITRRTLFLLFE